MTRERALPTALRQRSPIGGLGPSVKPQNHTSLNRGGRIPSKVSAELIVCSLTANGGDVRQFHVEENRFQQFPPTSTTALSRKPGRAGMAGRVPRPLHECLGQKWLSFRRH